MTNIYETTIIVKPDLANDQMKNLTHLLNSFLMITKYQLVTKRIGELKT